jgi:hypothetical protein
MLTSPQGKLGASDPSS